MTLARFAPLIGESFTVATTPEASPLDEIVLTQAELSPRANGADRPFHLVFESAEAGGLEQLTYWLARANETPEPVFLVPIGPRQYEAIFN